MSMFVPFLLALLTTLTAIGGHQRMTMLFWLATMVVAVWWLALRSTSPLPLSF